MSKKSTMLHDLVDESFIAYLEAADRYTNSVDQLSRLAGSNQHAAFLVSHERVKRQQAEVKQAHSALTKRREYLKRSEVMSSATQV
jgi:hypothetical protein